VQKVGQKIEETVDLMENGVIAKRPFDLALLHLDRSEGTAASLAVVVAPP
jgi:hypothetical protein